MSDSESDNDMGLGDLMPREPSPEPAPPTFSTYEIPAGVGLEQKEIVVRLVGNHPLWGHHLWNTARVTTTYLLSHPVLCKGRVLELGAGGALPSIACALAGADVVATDYADDALMENIAFNAHSNHAQLASVGHTWGYPVEDLLAAGRNPGRFDVVILSDLMFNHSQHEALIKTLEGTLKLGSGVSTAEHQGSTASIDANLPPTAGSPQTPCALVFLTHHRPRLADADMAFMHRLAERGWGFERVTQEWTGPMFKDDPGDERVRGTVHGFRCWRL